MAILFGGSAERLLRAFWSTPLQLAQELYAILSSDTPLDVTSDVTVNNNSTTFGRLQPNAPSPFTPAGVAVNKTPPGTVTFNGDVVTNGGVSMTGPTTIDNLTINGDTTQVVQPDGTAKPLNQITTPDPSSSSGPFSAEILEGAGDTYQVQVSDGSFGTMTVPYIAADEELPAGYVVFPVFKVGGGYVGQPPVWAPAS